MNAGLIHRSRHLDAREPSVGEPCGVPLDAEHFDESSIQELLPTTREVVLARFQLQPQYCGVFENFSQFVGDGDGRLLTVMRTEGLEWLILVNRRPLYPYLKLEHIVNPWGLGGFPVSVRLEDSTSIEFVVRVNQPVTRQTVGGRITGRYWYNPSYGDAPFTGKQFR
jgi:hypothetical protein